MQIAIEREKDYSDKLYVDWWIFEGEAEKYLKIFMSQRRCKYDLLKLPIPKMGFVP